MNPRNRFTCIWYLILGLSGSAMAAPLPAPETLGAEIESDALRIAVIEPHLSTAENNVRVEYIGYPAEEVIAAVLGPNWRALSDRIEFRALDGYAARIDVSKFERGNAYMAFARSDGADFTIDNIAQNETNVALGPYYLVWNTIGHPKLMAEGAGNWPYQISEIFSFSDSDASLLPDALDPRYREGAMLAKAYCLNCHSINGYGGDKFEGDIARIARGLTLEFFTDWVLDPSSLRNGTTMPALPMHLDGAERVRIAKTLYDYLTHLPAAD